MSQVSIYTANSIYTFDVGDWHSTVRGGVVGRQRQRCLPPEVVCTARDSGDLIDLIGRSLRFSCDMGDGTGWTPVTTSPVAEVSVFTRSTHPRA